MQRKVKKNYEYVLLIHINEIGLYVIAAIRRTATMRETHLGCWAPGGVGTTERLR